MLWATQFSSCFTRAFQNSKKRDADNDAENPLHANDLKRLRDILAHDPFSMWARHGALKDENLSQNDLKYQN